MLFFPEDFKSSIGMVDLEWVGGGGGGGSSCVVEVIVHPSDNDVPVAMIELPFVKQQFETQT